MARKDGKDRGILKRKGRDDWWVRLVHNGRERWHRCDTKSQAKALYGRLKAEIREGTYFPDKFKPSQDITLRAWITRYKDGITSPGLRNMKHYGEFWSKLLGRRLLTDLTGDELRHIQARMLAKRKRTPQTINRYFAGLRHILNLAIAEGKLITNPVKGVKFFREPQGRLRFLSDGEITRLREVMSPEHWPLVAFALETGLRLNEQFKARWDCVNLEQGVLTIPLSKSGRTRHVILSEAALAILRGLPSWMHSAYVFPSPRHAGEPTQGRHFVVKVYEPALEQAGIVGATWHTLRHTFASRAVMAGVDIRTVQELMGHSTITMTMRYAHLSPTHLREAVNKASLGQSMVKSANGTVTKTVTKQNQPVTVEKKETAEAFEELAGIGGGAGRVRTAASQFCRLLPYHLGTAPRQAL
jgi:integrase